MSLSNVQINPAALFLPNPPAGITAGRTAIFNPNIPNLITVDVPDLAGGRIHLVIDISSASLNTFVQAALASGPVAAKRTATGKGVELSKYFHVNPSTIPVPDPLYLAYKSCRNARYTGGCQANLDVFCVAGAEALCRERAVMLHIALAEAGVSTRVCFGIDSRSIGHVWVEYPSVGVATHLWDPTQGLQYHTQPKITHQQNRYPTNQQSVVLVNPINKLP